jgi:hypothetical protein
LATSLVAVITLAMGVPGIAAAAGADKAEISRYVLTETGLAKFTQASHRLAAVPGACAREDDDSDDSGAASIDEMVAKLNAVPGAQSAIQSAGMTTREYIVFMWSMMQSGMSAWAVKQNGKLPPGVAQANVDFYNKHEAAMAALSESDPCGKGDSSEDEGENPEN